MSFNNNERKRHIDRRLTGLSQERKSWEGQWKELAKLFLPYRSRFLGSDTNRSMRNTWLYDSSGRLAVRALASGMQSGLTSPSRPWFQLSLRDQELAARHEVRSWLHDTHERMISVLRGSNFYEQVHTLYGELAVFGTGCMLVEEDFDQVVRFRTLTAGEYYLDSGANGLVNTLYRKVQMSPAQIWEAWPETCPDEVRGRAERDDSGWLEVIHAIEPNPHWQENRDHPEERPFISVYLLNQGSRPVLEVSGYYEFPALCARWETTGSDVYGHGPAEDALADCRMLQRLCRDGLEALELEVKPPLNVTTGGNEPLDISPAAINYLPPAMNGHQAVTPLYQVRANLQALEVSKASLREQIRESLFNNLFLMLSYVDKTMTATEVAERNSEKMLMLGPVLDRMRSEVYQPLIARVCGIMQRQGMLAIPPENIQGLELEIEFVSILAQAQKQAGIGAVQQMVGMLGQLSQLDPGVLDKLDGDEAVNSVAVMLGVDPKVIRSAEMVDALRQSRLEEEQSQNALAGLQQGLGLARDAAGTAGALGIDPELLLGQGG